MGLNSILQHILIHPQTGRLSYLRTYPTALRPFIPAGSSGKPPAVLKLSLRTKDPKDPALQARYVVAAALFDATVAKARKLATGSYDALDAPRIAYLGKVFEAEWMKQHEATRWAKGPEQAAKLKAGWDWMLGDMIQRRGEADLDAMEKQWGGAATTLLAAQDHTLDPADDGGFRALCRELNDTAIRVSEVSLALLAGKTVPLPIAPPQGPFPNPQGLGDLEDPLSLLGLFDAYAIAAQIKPRTSRDWRHGILNLGAFLGHDDARKVTTANLLLWRDHLLTEPMKGGGTRQHLTVRGNYLGAVKAALSWAVENHKLPNNAAMASRFVAEKSQSSESGRSRPKRPSGFSRQL